MSDTQSEQRAGWHESNGDYLAAAIAWLRRRLQRLAPVTPAPEPVPEPTAGPFGSLLRRGTGRPALPPATALGAVSERDVEQAAEAMARAAAIDPPPALVILAQRLDLSRFEQDILLLCAAIELDTGLAALCAQAQGDPGRPFPTFALALALFDEPAWEALSPERPLRYWRLIEINQAAGQPLTTSPIRADERIVHYIKGMNYLDDRLAMLLVPFDVAAAGGEPLPPSQEATAQAVGHHVAATAAGRLPLLQFVGADTISKQLVAQRALAQMAIQPLRLPLELLPHQSVDVEALARLWQRESLLLPIALYLDAHNAADLNAPADAQAAALRRLLARDLGLVLLDTREVQPGLGVHSLPIDVDKPTPAEQQAAWVEALGPEAGTGPARLAGQFNLNLTTIQQVARAALPGPPGEPLTAAAWQSCLLRTRPRLDKLAQRLDPKVSWDDIVLPAEPEALLRQISAQVGQRATVYDTWGFRHKMNRGLGISALFVGESGTGKTMAAEVIANDLELNLYRIDLSAVVSKYIGETEKNLRQVFDAAEDGGVILFFDEADALFGKRSEVRDSHDRYANIEVNYLLQRMEAYRGLAILATNVRSALDPAFPRRLRFIVTFPYPGIPERRVMWDKVFPQPDAQRGHEGTPVEALDSDFLARIPLTGGSIHNTALGAAFLAAQAGTPVTMPLLLAAARTEVRKVEKPVSEAEFRLPSAVRARREAWQVRLADRASGEEMALHDIDYDRLAWHDVDDQAMAQALDRSVERARQANGALTTDLIAAELGKSRGLESGEPR